MKRTILFLGLLLSLVGTQAMGQYCNPDISPLAPGLYPNPIPTATINTPIATNVVTMLYPTGLDTTIVTPNIPGVGQVLPPFTVNATFTEFQVDSVSGLPAGLSIPIVCDKAACFYAVAPNSLGERGCMKISGSPTATGDYNVRVWSTSDGTYVVDRDVSLPASVAGFLGLQDTSIFKAGQVYSLSNPPANLVALSNAIKNSPFPIPGGGFDLNSLRRVPLQSQLHVTDPTGVTPELRNDLRFKLYPNPVNAASQLSYQLAENQTVRIEVQALNGQTVSTLVNERQNAGVYQYAMPAGLSQGVYLVKVQVGDKAFVQKVVY